MVSKPNIVIRFGASHDDISVDGVVFRRRSLDNRQFAFLRNVIIDTLADLGVVKRPTRRFNSPGYGRVEHRS